MAHRIGNHYPIFHQEKIIQGVTRSIRPLCLITALIFPVLNYLQDFVVHHWALQSSHHIHSIALFLLPEKDKNQVWFSYARFSFAVLENM